MALFVALMLLVHAFAIGNPYSVEDIFYYSTTGQPSPMPTSMPTSRPTTPRPTFTSMPISELINPTIDFTGQPTSMPTRLPTIKPTYASSSGPTGAPTTNIISTVVGSDLNNGDGGDATSAIVAFPCGLAVDVSGSLSVYFYFCLLIKNTALLGNVYIADCENNRIRKVTVSTGVIATVAGGGTDDGSSLAEYTGAATSASLVYPIAVGVDTSGKLCYIYYHISYLLVFAIGNVYIAENNHCVVRKVTVSTDTIAALAGTGNCSFSGDGGQATLAWLDQPYAVAADSEGMATRFSFSCSIIHNLPSI